MKTLVLLLILLLASSVMACDVPSVSVSVTSVDTVYIKGDSCWYWYLASNPTYLHEYWCPPTQPTIKVDTTIWFTSCHLLHEPLQLHLCGMAGHLRIDTTVVEDMNVLRIENNDTCIAWINTHKKPTSMYIDKDDFVDMNGFVWMKFNCDPVIPTPKQQLRIKIDTVAWLKKMEVYLDVAGDTLIAIHPRIISCELYGQLWGQSQLNFTPIEDTLYDLSPEQVEILGGVK